MVCRWWVLLWMAALALSSPGDTPAKAAAKPKTADAQAKQAYEAVVEAYMNSKWGDLKTQLRSSGRFAARMTASQRADLAYIRKVAVEYRPPWWKSCRSTAKRTIRARIWGKNIVANYVPADKPSMSGQVVGLRMVITVSWNPSFVGSTVAEKGRLAEHHGITKGDLGEVIVWRQLGYSYLSESLPIRRVMALYNGNRHLYQHLQALFANLTSMYHSSPKARRTAMLIHGSTLHAPGKSAEAYVRSCRAISSLLLAVVLAEPKKWPSIKLPYTLDGDGVERQVSTYVYNHVEPTWTLAEDRAFRNELRSFFRTNAARSLRNRGKLVLPNRTVFMLMEPDDRPFQAKRDEWVKKQVEKAAK